VVAFVLSWLVLIAGTVGIVLYAKRRPSGAPLTWGEAMVAALFVFTMMFVAYGIMPHQFLAYADNTLGWRKDKVGIPAGPLGWLFGSADNDLVSSTENVFFPKGVPLLNGYLLVSAEAFRDIVATLLYGIGFAVQIVLWSLWQKRGQEKPKALPTSAYGRPLVKKA
jgi:hypothetical protein